MIQTTKAVFCLALMPLDVHLYPILSMNVMPAPSQNSPQPRTIGMFHWHDWLQDTVEKYIFQKYPFTDLQTNLVQIIYRSSKEPQTKPGGSRYIFKNLWQIRFHVAITSHSLRFSALLEVRLQILQLLDFTAAHVRLPNWGRWHEIGRILSHT